MSDWLDVPVGVTEASIFGPLLVLIFSNDLPFLVLCSLNQFDDDSMLSSMKSSIFPITNELYVDCKNVADWMKSTQLCISVSELPVLV